MDCSVGKGEGVGNGCVVGAVNQDPDCGVARWDVSVGSKLTSPSAPCRIGVREK